MSRLVPVVLVLTLAGAPLVAADLEELVGEIFREEDPAARGASLARFEGLEPKDWSGLRALLHRAAPRPGLDPGTHRFTAPAADGVPAVEYALRVPPGYDPHDPEGLPLVLACHGTGDTGARFMAEMESILDPDAPPVLVACPDAPEPGVYRVSRTMTDYPLAVLADVRRRANVDADRVVLTGYSKGGYTTWGTALFSPGAWAGAVPIAGWPLVEIRTPGELEYLGNVLPLAIQHHWGENDILPGQTQGINTFSRAVAAEMKALGAPHYTPREYPGEGHRIGLDVAAVRAFVADARRQVQPPKAKLVFHHLWQGRAWVVRAVAGAEPDLSETPTFPIRDPKDVPRALREYYRKVALEVGYAYAPETNVLAVTARGVTAVEVDLVAGKVDFARPMRVMLNGRGPPAEKRAIDWALLFATARETYDFERLVAARVRLEVPSGS